MNRLFVISFFFVTNAFAWGPTGHRAVGEIATHYLTAKTWAQVNLILTGSSLARVSTWPDEIKSEPQTYKHTHNWHYTDWPDEMHEHSEENAPGLLMTSINNHLKVLKDPNANKDKKAFALKFITHLIGDLHQPLHIGNGHDMGGNNCKVIFHDSRTNLHALWDEKMINFSKLSFTELAMLASEGVTVNQVAEWKKGTPLDWAAESRALRDTVYPISITHLGENSESRQYCRKEVTTTQMPKLGYEYSYKFMPVVEQRIFQAGLRLAQLLNETL